MSPSPRSRQPLGSLDGPSRTITVEPVQMPVIAPPPSAPEPARKPDSPPAPKPKRAPAG